MFSPTGSVSVPPLTVETIAPIKDLYNFKGRCMFNFGGEEKSISIDLNSFLHRGSFLENSTSVIGLVVATGEHTKIQMNMGKYKFKMSRFEKYLNWILIGNLILALVLAFINVGLYGRWTKESLNVIFKKPFSSYLWYGLPKKLIPVTNPAPGAKPFIVNVYPAKLALQNFLSMYLIVNQFIPLDLLVAIEISKLVYTGVMEDDVQMMIEDYDIRDVNGFRANHLGLHEELSLVDYIFCDKTGTLTKNEMVFRGAVLPNGKSFIYNDSHPVSEMRKDFEKAGLS